jgi:transposase-like protein
MTAPASGRWTAAAKHTVVLALLRGDLTFAAALNETGATDAELANWLHQFGAHGLDGLKVRKCQTLRPIAEPIRGIMNKLEGRR